MQWRLVPATYPCPLHSAIDLSEQVWLKVLSPKGNGIWIGADPGTWVGLDYTALRYDVVTPELSRWQKMAIKVSAPRDRAKSPAGPFTIRVDCPGLPGASKDQDKTHRVTIRGMVDAYVPS